MEPMQASYIKLEFDKIKELLAEHALSDKAKQQCRGLTPFMAEDACRRAMAATTGARHILDACGSPPLTAMRQIEETLTLCRAGAMLSPEQLAGVERFLVACARMRAYLAGASAADETIASYGASFQLLPELSGEINRCLRAGGVDANASGALAALRRKMEQLAGQVRAELASLAQSKKQWLSDGGAVQRNGRYVLAVRREYKSKISGSVVEVSSTGSTVFIEPAPVAKLSARLAALEVEEDNEVRRVLYTLSALVDGHAAALRLNIEAMETLDFLFAKAKLSAEQGASPVNLTVGRRLALVDARHPLLPKERCVPLNLAMDAETRGVVITGPNTGGKTVALKTVGLLALMAQCGLHVTARPESELCLFAETLCDLGDGQSISENLSTFSSHMAAIIDILARAGAESLVLLDELGSGTDPAEGMGIAVAVLEALRAAGCMLVATTHYPEVKGYAEAAEGFTNARMAFNRETLEPTYRLELGLAGESCALYIARRLGLPEAILQSAERAAYGGALKHASTAKAAGTPAPLPEHALTALPASAPGSGQKVSHTQKLVPSAAPKPVSAHAAAFGYGDSVLVHPAREVGIVYSPAGETGQVGVQVKKEKRLVPHKRLELLAKADKLYPPDYDFSVVFDTVANRKARRQMEKRHVAGNVIHYDS